MEAHFLVEFRVVLESSFSGIHRYKGLYWQSPEKADPVGLASVSFLEPCSPPRHSTHILTHIEMTPILKEATVNTLVLHGGSWCFVFLPFQLADDTQLVMSHYFS